MIDLTNLKNNLDSFADKVGELCNLESISQGAKIDEYESLLIGSLVLRAKSKGCEDVNKLIPSITAILEWLRSTDFYISPASTKYHGSYPTGLLMHSLIAYNYMVQLNTLPVFNAVHLGSATLVILCHDWCKIGKYETYIKNEKNAQTGRWEEKQAYKYNDNYLGLGHGPQSLMMVTQFCNTKYTSLTFAEMAAIRWHMYTYDVTSYDINDLNKCTNRIPLVMLTQFADQLAARDD